MIKLSQTPSSLPQTLLLLVFLQANVYFLSGQWVLSWEDFQWYDWRGYQALLPRPPSWWDGLAGLGAALELTQVGSLTFSWWVGTSPALQQQDLSQQCRIHLTTWTQTTFLWHQDAITQEAGNILGFLPRKLRFLHFNLIPGASHCTEKKPKPNRNKQCKANVNRQLSFCPPQNVTQYSSAPLPRKQVPCYPHGPFFWPVCHKQVWQDWRLQPPIGNQMKSPAKASSD